MSTLADNINSIAKDAERDALNARKRWMDACHADDIVMAIKLRTEAEVLETFVRRLTDACGPLIQTTPSPSSERPSVCPSCRFPEKHHAAAWLCGDKFHYGADASVDRLQRAAQKVCVWRRDSDGYAVSGCAVPGWTWHVDRLQAFRFCPYCGKPLTLAPDEPIRPPVEGQTP